MKLSNEVKSQTSPFPRPMSHCRRAPIILITSTDDDLNFPLPRKKLLMPLANPNPIPIRVIFHSAPDSSDVS